MRPIIENLNLIQSSFKEKQFYIFYPNLKDQISTGYFFLNVDKIQFPIVGNFKPNYCLAKYTSINKGGKFSSSSKISFNHMLLCCRVGFQLKALPKFAKKNLTALILNKSIKNWAYEAYLEGGPKMLVKKPPFFSILWQNLEETLNSGQVQEIKIFPLYGGWSQKISTPYYFTTNKEYLSLVFGIQGSLIQKSQRKKKMMSNKKKFLTNPKFKLQSYLNFIL